MSSTLTARFIGACFGLAFVLANASDVPAPLSWLIRALGVVLFVGVCVRLRSAGEVRVQPRRSAIGVYWTSVVLEVAALVVGTRILATHGQGEYGVAWTAFIVGVHFVPFAWAFRQPAFRPLAVTLIALGVAGAAVGLVGGGGTGIAVVAGLGSGLALLIFAAAPSSSRGKAVQVARAGGR